jgi:hypothetical protein
VADIDKHSSLVWFVINCGNEGFTIGSSLVYKYQVRGADIDKHSSLVWFVINWGNKSFIVGSSLAYKY